MKLLINLTLLFAITIACNAQQDTISGYSFEFGDSLIQRIAYLESNPVTIYDTTIIYDTIVDRDSIEIMKAYIEAINPFDKNNYNVYLDFNDSILHYNFSQDNGNSWTRIYLDEKTIQLFQIGDEIQLWYKNSDSSKAYMINFYDVGWFE